MRSASTTCRSRSNSPLRARRCSRRPQLLERLGDRLDLLRGGRDAETRQHTLRSTIEWSYELLNPNERKLLAALSVFRAAGPRSGGARRGCRPRAHAIARRQEPRPPLGLGRFGMLETIRAFAAEQLSEEEQLPCCGDCFATCSSCSRTRISARRLTRRTANRILRRTEESNIDVALGMELRPRVRRRPAADTRSLPLEMYWTTNDPTAGLAWIVTLCSRPGRDETRAAAAGGNSCGCAARLYVDERMDPVGGIPHLRPGDRAVPERPGDEARSLEHPIHRLAHLRPCYEGDLEEGGPPRPSRRWNTTAALGNRSRRGRGLYCPCSRTPPAATRRQPRAEANPPWPARVPPSPEQAGFTWWHGVTLLTVAEWLLQEPATLATRP